MTMKLVIRKALRNSKLFALNLGEDHAKVVNLPSTVEKANPKTRVLVGEHEDVDRCANGAQSYLASSPSISPTELFSSPSMNHSMSH